MSGATMKKDVIITLVLASTILGTVLLTVRFGKFFDPTTSCLHFSRELTFTTNNSVAVVIDSDLFTVSSYLTYISIESTNWDYSNCIIPLHERERISDRIRSEAVGDKMLLWGFNKVDDQHFHANLTFLLLDPWNCSYKPLSNLKYLGSKLSTQVIINQNYFDVFLSNRNEKCSPCRFDENGEEILMQSHIKPENVPINSTHIKSFNEGSSYVYVINFQHEMAVMKILDQDFNIVNQINASFMVNEIALTSNPTNTWIGILYQLPKHQWYISVLDISLQTIFTARLPCPHAYEVASAHLTIDSQGNSFVTSVLLGNTDKCHLLRYNSTGHLNYEIELDKARHGGTLITQSFLIDDREYCLVNHREVNNKTGHTYLKCISINEM